MQTLFSNFKKNIQNELICFIVNDEDLNTNSTLDTIDNKSKTEFNLNKSKSKVETIHEKQLQSQTNKNTNQQS